MSNPDKNHGVISDEPFDPSNKKQRKRIKRYQRTARVIHDNWCDSPDCTYGKKPPKHMRIREGMVPHERQRRAREQLAWRHDCNWGVWAENTAALLSRREMLK